MRRFEPSLLLLLGFAGCYFAGSAKQDGDGTSGTVDWDTAGDSGDAPPEDSDTTDSADTGEACDDTTPVRLYLSPDDSNSMSSPVQARLAALDHTGTLQRVPIRTYEFMNYYGFAYPPAEEGLVVSAGMAPAVAADTYELQIGVTGPWVEDDARAPMNLTFSIDTSGSMALDPIDAVRQIGRAISAKLREGDIVSILTWDTTREVLLDSWAVTGPNDPTLIAAFDGLEALGSTNLSGGLIGAYELAERNFSPDRINRVILISDGGANVGVTDEDLIATQAGGESATGIFMMGVGVGTPTTYNDTLMDAVTDAGKGSAVYVVDSAEILEMFGDRFEEVFDVAARSVQVRLDLPPGFSIVRYSGEEYSGDPTEVQRQNLAPNDAMVFYQTVATCAPEAVTEDSSVTVTVSYLDPVTFEPRETTLTRTFAELMDSDAALLAKGRAVYTYAEALKSWQQDAQTPAVAAALEVVALAEVANPGDDDLAEIRAVLQAL